MKILKASLFCSILLYPSYAYSWSLIDDAVGAILRGGSKIIRASPKRSDVIITGIAVMVGVVVIKLDDINLELDKIGLKLSGEDSIDEEFLKDVVMAVAEEQQNYVSIRVCRKPNGDLFPTPNWFEVCPFSGKEPLVYNKRIPISSIN